MKKILWAVFVFTILSIPLFAQVEEKDDQNILLEENFVDDSNGWSIFENDNFSGKLENGSLIYQNKHYDTLHRNTITLMIDEEKDFSIITTTFLIEGEETNPYCIVWGFKNRDNFYALNISNSQNYQIFKYENGVQTIITYWSFNEYLNFFSPNRIEIRKINNELIFYANNRGSFETIPYEKFFGNEIGFVLLYKNTIKIDELIVKGTKGKIIEPEEQSSYDLFGDDMSDYVFGKKNTDNYDNEFQKAFNQILSSAKNDYKDIVTTEIISVGTEKYSTEYPSISVAFPDAKCEYYWEDDYFGLSDVANPTVTIDFYKKDDDPGNAAEIFERIKKNLLDAQRLSTDVKWFVTENASHRIKMRTNDSSLPWIKLTFAENKEAGYYAVYLEFQVHKDL